MLNFIAVLSINSHALLFSLFVYIISPYTHAAPLHTYSPVIAIFTTPPSYFEKVINIYNGLSVFEMATILERYVLRTYDTLYIFSDILTLNVVTVDKVILPDVIQSGTPEGAVLDCLYTVNTSQYTLQWLFNNSDVPVYEWKPNTEPVVGELLDGRLDLTYRASSIN